MSEREQASSKELDIERLLKYGRRHELVREIKRLRDGLQMIADEALVPDAFPAKAWKNLDDAQRAHMSALLIAKCTLEGGEHG